MLALQGTIPPNSLASKHVFILPGHGLDAAQDQRLPTLVLATGLPPYKTDWPVGMKCPFYCWPLARRPGHRQPTNYPLLSYYEI
jgi:hypothetical protein